MATKKPTHIEVSEGSLAFLALANKYPAFSRILEESLILNRRQLQLLNEPLAFVASEFETARKEALALSERLKEFHDLHSWRQYIANNPPSADAIAYLVVIQESEAISQESDRRKRDLSSAGAKGGAGKGGKLSDLKKWAVTEGRKRNGTAVGIARSLLFILPSHLKEVDAADPARVMADAIRADRKNK